MDGEKLRQLVKTMVLETIEQHQLVSPKTIPSRLYHATFDTLTNLISKNGLTPGKTANFAESDKRFVYLTVNATQAQSIIKDLTNDSRITRRLGEKINVLTIDTSGLDKKKFFVDPYSGLLQVTAYMYNGIIPPTSIIDYGD